MSGFYFLVIVTIISAIVSLGFSLNAVADRKQNQKSQTNALYALSRSLFLLSIIALFTGSAAFLTGVALAVALTHIFDGFIGIILKNNFKTYGPFITGFLHLVIIAIFA